MKYLNCYKMKLITKLENVFYISILNQTLLIQYEFELTNMNNGYSVEANRITTYNFNNFIYSRSDNKIRVYNSDLSQMAEYIVKNNIGVYNIFSLTSLAISTYEDEQRKVLFIQNGVIVKEVTSFFGRILNENYKLNFPENIFVNSKYFRCSDLLDEKTYWEYTCPPGLQASNTWVVRGEYLLFCENTDGSYQGNIKKIHLPTGELKWEAAVPMTRLHYNESQGIFISFWANVDYGQYYQIIDVDNETIEFGNPITDVTLQNLPSTEGTLYLYERKLYFTDFSNVYGDQIPKIMFGCFDIDTKEVEFLQEVPEAKGDGFAQVIYSDNKLYLRSFGNKLYVYEHEITAS